MYTKLVDENIKWHNIKYRCYADYAQVYITLKPYDKWDDITYLIEACFEDTSIWMNSTMLKLNKGKT